MITRRNLLRLSATTPVVVWAGSRLASPAAAVPPTVSIDWTETLTETTALSFGLNSPRFHDPAVTTTTEFLQNLRYMSPGLLRLHAAGVVSDGIWIDEATQTWLTDKIHDALEPLVSVETDLMMNIPKWPAYMRTYDVIDANGVVVAPLLHPDEYERYAALCAELVRIVNIEHGRGIRLWEPTNERDGLYVSRLLDAGLPDRIDELVEIHTRCAVAMRAVDPTIEIGGAAFASPENLTTLRTFVRDTYAAGALDFVSFHVYGTADTELTDDEIFALPWDPAGGVSMTSKAAAAVAAIADEVGSEVPTYWNEYNINYDWRDNETRMQDHHSAIFDALILIHAAEIGVTGTAAWADRDRVYGKTDMAGVRRPGADLFQVFNSYLRGRWVALTLPDRAVVDGCAAELDGGHRSLALVNRSGVAEPLSVESTHGPLVGTVSVHTLDATGYSIEASTWQQVRAGLTLPPQSVTVITDSPTVPTITPDPAPPLAADSGSPAQAPETAFLHGAVLAGSGRSLDGQSYEGWTAWPKAAGSGAVAATSGSALERIPLGGIDSLISVAAGVPLRWEQGWTGPDGVEPTGTMSSSDVVSFSAPRAALTAARPGWQVTLPAGTGLRTVDVHVGVTGARAQLTASLSGPEEIAYATPTTGAERIENASGTSNYRVRLRYRASSDEQTLTIALRTTYVHYGERSAWIQAIGWTAGDSDRPSAPLWDRVDLASDSVTLSWHHATDPSGSVSHYEVYSGATLAGATEQTSLRLRGLDRSAIYTLRVAAVDQSGNLGVGAPIRIRWVGGRRWVVLDPKPAELC